MMSERAAIEGHEHERVISDPCRGQVVHVVDTGELLVWDGRDWVEVNDE